MSKLMRQVTITPYKMNKALAITNINRCETVFISTNTDKKATLIQ